MNILVPHTWLQDHLQTSARLENIQKYLSLSGPSVERIHEIEQEKVMDIEVTTNRMDMASVRGIAREAAAILPRAGFEASLKTYASYRPTAGEIVDSTEQFPISIQNDISLCSCISAVMLEVTQKPSPDWMRKRLEQTGIRSLNNLVDVTNYVMSEIGHPAHVFDADRLGNTMIVRKSRAGESIVGLDDKTYTLSGGDIVIDNGKGEIIDLIAIIGTANSVVVGNTKRILFFIDHADPKKIRASSMKLGIRTKAAQLNEKMLDPNLVMDALLRGIALYQQIADAKVVSPILDMYPQPIQPRVIQYPLEKTQQYLGISLDATEQVGILESLGCQVEQRAEQLQVTVPTYRPDLEQPVDIVEEIARIFGYHNIPSTLMASAIPTKYPKDLDIAKEHDVKQFLAAIGQQEVYTYSAVSKELAVQSGFGLDEHLAIENPLVDDHVYMRRSLIPSHEEVLRENAALGAKTIFEFANVYIPQPQDRPKEELHLTLTSTESFEKLKGYAEALLEHLFIFADGATTSLRWVRENTYAADFIWHQLLAKSRKYPEYKPLPKFSPIIEDFTFAIPESAKIGEVIESIKTINALVQTIELLDQYKRNFTFRVQFNSAEKQISGEDVKPVRESIIALLKNSYNAPLVGEA